MGFWISLLRDVLRIERHPVLLDTDPGCGARAIATAALAGAYVYPDGLYLAGQEAVWESSSWPAHAVDDGSACVDVAVCTAGDAMDFEQAIDELGPRSAVVVAVVPTPKRDEVARRVPGVRFVRLRSRPFRHEYEVIAMWSQ